MTTHRYGSDQLHPRPVVQHPTIREQAHQLNISISEIRKRRQGYKTSGNHGLCMCHEHVRERLEAANRS